MYVCTYSLEGSSYTNHVLWKNGKHSTALMDICVIIKM